MATKKEFEMITKMYLRAVGAAHYEIDMSIKRAKELHGFEDGSALTDLYRRHLKKATKGIEPLMERDENGFSKVVTDENGLSVYDKKDALKMLKAVEYINTYIVG